MGSLANIINAPVKIKVKDETFNVKRLTIMKVFQLLQDALALLDPDLKGIALQDETQKCLETGKIPVGALSQVIFESMKDCNDGFDAGDAEAIASLGMDTIMEICSCAMGLESDEAEEADAEKKTEKK